jgi:hypothetical protein
MRAPPERLHALRACHCAHARIFLKPTLKPSAPPYALLTRKGAFDPRS